MPSPCASCLQWLAACLALQSAQPKLAPAGALAAVGGGAIPALRAQSATVAAQEKGVAGFALCGFGTGEPPEQRPALLAAAVDQLPPEKPRFISGMVGLCTCHSMW